VEGNDKLKNHEWECERRKGGISQKNMKSNPVLLYSTPYYDAYCDGYEECKRVCNMDLIRSSVRGSAECSHFLFSSSCVLILSLSAAMSDLICSIAAVWGILD
jgi:hypothetical protein